MGHSIDRRTFAVGIGAATAAAVGALAGCSPSTRKSEPASEGNWDKEADFVVVGSGTGLFGALMAAKEGATAIVVEKSDRVGGTTALSGNGCWVPNNRHMKEHGIMELPEEEIVRYIDACDVYKTGSMILKENYVSKASRVFDYIEDVLGFRLDTDYNDPKFEGKPVRGDYYPLPGNIELGRSLFFLNDKGVPLYTKNYTESVIPYAESLGIEMLTGTPATSLVLDERGSVVGIEASKNKSETLRIKASKGVLLSAGGFDHNKEMVRQYLRGPVYGSNAVQESTGDAHAMGQVAGAAFGNMASCWGLPFFKNAVGDEYSTAYDWSTWRTKPYSLIVNSKGRRFASESSAYSIINLAFYSYDSGNCAYLNLPAYFICDSRYVANYGFPGQKTKEGEQPSLPEYVKMYESIGQIAADLGIDKESLENEIERFNSFAHAGKDLDWARGEYFHESRTNGDLGYKEKGLSNPCLGPVEEPPFYVAEIGPGTCGTNGGLLVNENSQVLRADGSAIEGLYAGGNTAASIFGSGYPGAGGTVGPGIFQAMMAADHALGLSKF